MTDDAQQLFSTPPTLTDRQQRVLALVDRDGITALIAGAVLHRHCRYCIRDGICQYAESAGREVLESLRRKGLIRRDRQHRYYPIGGATPNHSNELPGDF